MLMIGLAAGATLLMVAGYVQIQKEPYTWSLIIAGIWTAILAMQAISGNVGPDVQTFLAGAWTLGCWMMVPTTKRMKQLLAQHPDLWVAQRIGATGASKKRSRR